MSQEEFFDNLRHAWRDMIPPTVGTGSDEERNRALSRKLSSTDLWLTPKSVDGFEAGDFTHLPSTQLRELIREVDAFRNLAEQVPADKPAPARLSAAAGKHLKHVFATVREQLLADWIAALEGLIAIAVTAADSKNWTTERDKKEIRESLLGAYQAPRLHLKSADHKVILDPIAYFGSGRQSIVDFVVLPTFETVYLLSFKNENWWLTSAGSAHRRKLTASALIETISKLPAHATY